MGAGQWALLLFLSLLWGSSFFFQKTILLELHPFTMVFGRLSLAAAALYLVMLSAGFRLSSVRGCWAGMILMGAMNNAIPFCLFAWSQTRIASGLAAIFNATAPLWAALIGWLWLGDRPGRSRIAGLVVGFAGVVALAAGNASLRPGEHGVSPAAGVLACLAATLFYGIGANYTKKRLAGAPPLAVAAGSQLAAAVALALRERDAAPAALVAIAAWGGAAALAFVCTGVAYLLYFRLIAHVGGANAIAVTFLIPAFAIAWGWLFLDERVTWPLVAGCAVILAGTALATGLLRLPLRARGAPRAAG